MKKNKQTSISLFLALLFICSFYNVTIYSSEKKVAKRKHKIINNNHKKQKLSPHNSSNDNMSNNSNNNDNKSNDMNNMCEFFYSLLSEKMEIEKNCKVINNNHKKQKLSPHNSSNDNMSNNSNNNDNKSNDMNNMCEFFYSLLIEKMEIEKNCEEK